MYIYDKIFDMEMIHAYASIWRCLKSAHKGGNGNNCQAVYREYMKGEEGV